MKRTSIPRDPKSEAAIKWAIKNWRRAEVIVVRDSDKPIFRFIRSGTVDCDCIIDLRDIVRKRQPLTGVKRQLARIVAGRKKIIKKGKR